MSFIDREDAGRRLAAKLTHLQGKDVVVLGLPRGGVPVAYEVAEALGAPLDVIVVRKLGVPYQPELGMGALGEGGIRILNESVMRSANIREDELAEVEARERTELERRASAYRGERPRASLVGRTAVIVDDGIATGSTARAACRVARAQGASRVVLAVPVAPRSSLQALSFDADEVVCVETPEMFFAIGEWYADFAQTSDEQVVALLDRASRRSAAAADTIRVEPRRRGIDEEVTVVAGTLRLPGHLTVPPGAPGIVVFAHGSGSSRLSPRNRYVASTLNESGLGTLLFDLLTRDEEAYRANVFDIELLARRLADATAWLRKQPAARGCAIGYFGASTGAAAALWAAAETGAEIAAVVSRGGRPDLAGPRLGSVTAPTLLIVGGYDEQVLELNHQARARLRCTSELSVVPGATHLFEEPGTLEAAARLACDWFAGYLVAQAAPTG